MEGFVSNQCTYVVLDRGEGRYRYQLSCQGDIMWVNAIQIDSAVEQPIDTLFNFESVIVIISSFGS